MIVQIFLFIAILPLFLYSLKLLHNGNRIGWLVLIGSILCMVFDLYPDATGYIANMIGVGRGTDLLLYVSFGIGLLLFLILHAKIHSQSVLITKLIRKISIIESTK